MPKDKHGDPDGRRIAARRAAQLEDAGRTAAALRVLMRRSGVGVDALDSIEALIKHEEERARMMAHGPIESRQRYRTRTASPLLEGRLDNLLFIDESGTAHRTDHENDPPWFALGGVAISRDGVEDYVRRADHVKREFWGDSDITFHEPLMRKGRNEFHFRGDRGKQTAFAGALDELVAETDFRVFGVGIRKKAFWEEFVDAGVDPYLPSDVYCVSIQMLLERYVRYLQNHQSRPFGRVTFESQSTRQDAEHQRDYVETLLYGTQWVSDREFMSWLRAGVDFVPKSGSHPTELSDMWSRDVFEWIRSDCKDEPARWKLWSKKIWLEGDLQQGNFGLKIFPATGLGDRVQAHRESVAAVQGHSVDPN